MFCVLLADVELLQREFEHLGGDELVFLVERPLEKDPVNEKVGAVMAVLDDLVVVRDPAKAASIPLAKIAKRIRILSDGRYGVIEPNDRDMALVLNILGKGKHSLDPVLAQRPRMREYLDRGGHRSINPRPVRVTRRV